MRKTDDVARGGGEASRLPSALRAVTDWAELAPLLPQLATSAGQAEAEALGELLPRLCMGADRRLKINLALLCQLARLMTARGLLLSSPDWQELARQITTHIAAQSGQAPGDHMILALAVRGLTEGRMATLRWALGHALGPSIGSADALNWYKILHHAGILADEVQAAEIAGAFSGMLSYGDVSAVARLLLVLGMTQQRSMAYLRAVFEGAALPAMLNSLKRDKTDTALQIEQFLATHWLPRHECESHYDQSYRLWAGAFARAGRAAGRGLPRLPEPGPESRIGFFLHQASTLSHVMCFHDAMAAARRAGRPLPAVLYIWHGHNAELNAMMRALDVEVVEMETLPGLPSSLTERFLWLRQRLAADKVGLLVWLCVPCWQSFAFSMRLAPRQLWWSMKYHPAAVEGADVLLSLHGRAREKAVWHGREWQTVPYTVLLPPYAPRAEEVAALRAPFGDAVICFTPSRPEKMLDLEFLETVVAILKAAPEAIWAYPGHEDTPAIRETFAAAGLAERVRWVGWVDTALWGHVADLVLDSFPHSTGLTGAQAMAAATPVLFRLLPEGHDGFGMFDMLLGDPLRRGLGPEAERQEMAATFTAADGTELLMAAETPADYVAQALRLIRDPALRAASGAAYQRYAGRWLCDTELLGNRFADVLLHAKNQKTQKEA
ncbi:hypothetical protein NON00_08375 [Roseomonas sp. GC11]|uniref:hypothetical protein n=1 Tax=Roseomonas sp. GC11 TaxID=2950546 RepID=UPI002108EE73|nr:hypothetical protein [Roseomonas sp. GC11]MCQ4159944.1 hypothetical protein [Roseomonas sp. GC11]